MSGPRIGELFSGYGGLGHGVQSVYGGTIAWHSDIDKGACKILAHRYPDVPNLGDITTVDWSTVEPVDILTGGSPCQDLSHAGRRAGMTEGTRSNLWVAMREAIAQLRPAMVVWENVGGAFSAAANSEVEPCAGCVGDGSGVHLRALGRVLGDLASLGFDASWHALRAADVGAAHGRLRVFVVARDAHRVEQGALSESRGRTSAEPSRVRAAEDSEREGWRAAWDATPGQTASGWTSTVAGRPSGVAAGEEGLTLLPTPAVNDMGDRPWANPETWDAWTEKLRAAHGNGIAHGASLAIEAQRLLPTPRVKNNENRQSEGYGGEDGNFYGLLHGASQWGDYGPAIARWEHALGRPAPASTMTSSKGNPQLSPVFVEWLMGLPAGWVTDVPGITRNEALKALGNGVVPQQAATALRVMAAWAVAA